MEQVKKIKVSRPEGEYLIAEHAYEQSANEYNALFSKLMENLGNDPSIQCIYFGPTPDSDKCTIQMGLTSGVVFIPPEVYIEEDHSTDNAMVYKALFEYSKKKEQNVIDKDPENKYAGIYKPTGKKIVFSRIYGTYRFNDAECQRLLAGEKVMIDTISKNGSEYYSYGGLEQKMYENVLHWGYKSEDRIFKNYIGHKITPTEAEVLFKSGTVFFPDLVSKSGRKFSKSVYYDKNTKKLEFEKENNSYVENYDPRAAQEVDTGSYGSHGWREYGESDYDWSGKKW